MNTFLKGFGDGLGGELEIFETCDTEGQGIYSEIETLVSKMASGINDLTLGDVQQAFVQIGAVVRNIRAAAVTCKKASPSGLHSILINIDLVHGAI